MHVQHLSYVLGCKDFISFKKHLKMDTLNHFAHLISVHLVLLPIAILITPFRWVFDFFTISHPDLFRRPNNPEIHDRKVKAVQKQVQKWNKNGRKTKMCTARPGWQSMSLRELDKSRMTQIKLELEDIIEIDVKRKILRVEPGMKMGTLTYKLLRLGWTIPIVPELETLTIGGLINGAGLETSSHKYGLFADICIEFEVVLGDGSKITCSKDKNKDIFYAIPMSYGTLGFLTSVTLPIIPVTKYVKVEYVPTASVKETERLMRKSDCDFVEGLVFDKDRSVVMYGTMVDRPDPAKINHLNRWYKKFFFSHVEKFLTKKDTRHIEYLQIRDYYFRHQRGYFWETSSIAPICNNQLFLFFFGWMHPMNFQLNKFFTPKCLIDVIVSKRHVLQDFVVPMDKLGPLIELSDTELGVQIFWEIYPLWLCPTRRLSSQGMTTAPNDELYVDVGIYGNVEKEFNPVETCRKFEKFAIDNRGFQGLYADSYLSREEFRLMFDMKLYDEMREKLKCKDAFPDVYDKVSLAARNRA